MTQMAREQGSVAAFQMLSQLAGQDPQASETLLELVSLNQVPFHCWQYMKPFLAGERLHFLNAVMDQSPGASRSGDFGYVRILSGNQSYYLTPDAENLTGEKGTRKMAVLDRLLAATSDPAAQQTLQQAKALLASRIAPQTAGLRTGQ